jgi:hypothetical protein
VAERGGRTATPLASIRHQPCRVADAFPSSPLAQSRGAAYHLRRVAAQPTTSMAWEQLFSAAHDRRSTGSSMLSRLSLTLATALSFGHDNLDPLLYNDDVQEALFSNSMSSGVPHTSRTVSRTDNRLIERLGHAISLSTDILGILVYGSAITSHWDRCSDVDFICVRKSGEFARAVRTIDGFEVDVSSGSRRSIERRLYSFFPGNNNSVLYAFQGGRSVIDRDGSIAALVYEASALWAQGPSIPKPDELMKIAAASRNSWAAADRLQMRATRPGRWREVVHLRSADLFINAINDYCRCHLLWASAISEMLKWTDPRYDCLLSVLRAYLDEPSLRSRLQAIQSVATFTLASASAALARSDSSRS